MKKGKRKEWIIGLFSLGALVLLVGSYIYLRGENVFTKVCRYYVKFDNVDGLYVGNRVMLNGLTVGKVASMSYTGRKGAAILVELQLDPGFQLNATALAGIVNSGLIGGRVVKLFNAVGDGPYLRNRDTIPGRTDGALAESIEESIGPLMGRVDTLICGLTQLTASLNGMMTRANMGHVNSIVAHLNTTFENLAGASAMVKPMLNSINNAAQDVAGVAKSADSSIIAAGGLVDSLRRLNFQSMFASLERASQSADSLLAALQRGEGTAGMLLRDDSLYRQAQTALASFDSLVTDIKRHPKRYIRISVF